MCYPFNSLLPVKQLEIRLTVFVGHSKKHMYLIFTVMMSILFLSVLVSQRVNLDALFLIAERQGSSCRRERSRSFSISLEHWCNCVEMVWFYLLLPV